MDARLHRIDANWLRLDNCFGVDTQVLANDEVPIEAAAVDELLALLELQRTLERFEKVSSAAFDGPARVEKVIVTPDFHKAAGIPVGTVMKTRGFVLPQAIGNDVNCGMRLHTSALPAETVLARLDELETTLRHLFFEGGRNLPMTRSQRLALLTRGLPGLLDAVPRTQSEGLWARFHESTHEASLEHVASRGGLPADAVFGLDDFMGPREGLSRDSQIGSIGGGNHFVEVQSVQRIFDARTAHQWGLRRGMVTVMVHTGSVAIGHVCGRHYREQVRGLFPKTLSYPANALFPLPTGQAHQAQGNCIRSLSGTDLSTATIPSECREDACPSLTLKSFWNALHNAANFAFANRHFLALMAVEGLCRVLGEFEQTLLYDAPHNLVWREHDEQGEVFVHRKGACPARGFEAMAESPFAFTGEPVLVPGSMGASSFVMAGQGNADALCSASHGAGRRLSRGQASRSDEAAFRSFLERFRIVTPVDLRRQDVKLRRDIVARKLAELRQEAPQAYKDLGPIVTTLRDAGVARPVAELRPLMTLKA